MEADELSRFACTTWRSEQLSLDMHQGTRLCVRRLCYYYQHDITDQCCDNPVALMAIALVVLRALLTSMLCKHLCLYVSAGLTSAA